MKRVPGVGAALALALAGAASCVSFDIRRFPQPENAVASFLLCKNVDGAAELIRPVEVTSEFAASDGRVISFASVRNVIRSLRLRWKWYAPSKALVRDTGDVEVNPEGKNLEVVTAYDALTLDSGKPAAGAWTVILLIDGRLAARRNFTISGGDGSSPRESEP